MVAAATPPPEAFAAVELLSTIESSYIDINYTKPNKYRNNLIQTTYIKINQSMGDQARHLLSRLLSFPQQK